MSSRDETEPASSRSLGYLPALDGLRALAVAMVVGYHLDLPWATGGFLGVDVFFVISGFLITSLLLRERDATGRIALGSFWLRRFRRLVPPLVVVVAAVVIATRWFGVPQGWSSVRRDVWAALGYVANWRFVAADQSYFDTLLGPSPLRHTWSLALEEQWYVIWPLVVVGLCAIAARRSGSWRLPSFLVGLAAVASAVAMAVLHEASDPSRVYYGTDTRAQHLLVGALLAIVAWRRPSVLASSIVRSRLLVHLALGVVVIAAVVVDDRAPWLYHGGLLAVSFVAALLVASTAAVGGSTVPWLGARPLVWLGQRSYGIYLWHWPVIVFVGAPMGVDLSPLPLAAVQVAVSLALATVSYRLIEQPVRFSSAPPSLVFGRWAVGTVAVALVGAAVLVAPHGGPTYSADVVRPTLPGPVAAAPATSTEPPPSSGAAVDPSPTSASPGDPMTASETGVAEANPLGPVDTAAELAALRGRRSSLTATPAVTAEESDRLLLLGDSTAFVMSFGDPMSERWSTHAFARLGCSTTTGGTIDVDATEPTEHGSECADWHDDWTASRALVEPDIAVVMIGAWEVLDHVVDGRIVRFPGADWTASLRTSIEAAAAVAAGPEHGEVVLLRLPCMNQADTADFSALARNDPARIDAFNDVLEEVAARHHNVRTLPLDHFLCPDGASRRGSDGRDLRYDGVHLTTEGVDLTWAWLVEQLGDR